MAKLYSLKKKVNTNEMHLFECTPSVSSCFCNQKSMCAKMDKNEPHTNEFLCNDENAARVKIANKGRQVCGNCTSQLYTTY
jgi:hypothetical protein